ncbi:DUF58 domain-containing protein [Brachybacterium sp. J153]|uniref:DUF58 domain-containing protein n=1 Tax=Brachybacterium sp. J153 TaxID=3116488 RepID=UPI002E77AC3D|nr:DUF58 domain-containing protein [Brachybacterium sp. J153]MEE1617879.1 DUF58 domain-containing protein [Brachybacterium sp. J153]
MSARPGTVLRPTARGVLLAVLAVVCWLLADLTNLVPLRSVAAALLLLLLLGAAAILLAGTGLRLRRRVLDDAVAVGGRARVQIELTGRPLLPLGRGILREHLPEALGGERDLPLQNRMPHALTVGRRGAHRLGPCSLLLRDLFGLFQLRRTSTDALRITGVPVITALTPLAARTAGLGGRADQGAGIGVGEIGPIARPYVAGDDIRRIHWRASARSGQLMTREDEPVSGRSAMVVLDTTSRPGMTPAVEDRLVSHAATLLDVLGAHGWEVRILDASGDEITRTGRRRGLESASPLGGEADALELRAGLLALAEVDFDDEPARVGHDHAAGLTSLALALGLDDGEPFAGLDLDRFAGRSSHRTALALRSDPAAPAAPAPPSAAVPPSAPTRRRLGAWTLVTGTLAHSLDDLLTAPEPGSPA